MPYPSCTLILGSEQLGAVIDRHNFMLSGSTISLQYQLGDHLSGVAKSDVRMRTRCSFSVPSCSSADAPLATTVFQQKACREYKPNNRSIDVNIAVELSMHTLVATRLLQVCHLYRILTQ